MGKTTISEVVKNNLCTGCGTCLALCPNKAITLEIDVKKSIYLPELDKDKCNHCGICRKVCPGNEVDFKALNHEIFSKKVDNILIGNYLNCYVGYSTDYDVRYNSASGGLITQLLIFALEERIIDGALVTRMKKDSPLEPEPFIARTKEEVIEASKSKYCPVPTNVALKDILESNDGEKFAVVGLPCHIQGIRKAEQINKKLKEKIILHLGIMCSHTLNFMATEFMLNKLGANRSEVEKLNYRGEGWPGKLLIQFKNGDKKYYPFSLFGRLHLLHFFAPKRCLICIDQNCELSDISFGDAWLPEYISKDNKGTSIIAVRTKIAEELLQKAIFENKLNLNRIDHNILISSQKDVIRFKKRNAYLSTFKKKPIYNSDLLKPEFRDYLTAIIFQFHIYVSQHRRLWPFILPLASLEKYFKKSTVLIYKVICSVINLRL